MKVNISMNWIHLCISNNKWRTQEIWRVLIKKLESLLAVTSFVCAPNFLCTP